MTDDNFRNSLRVVDDSVVDSSADFSSSGEIIDSEEFVNRNTRNYVALYNIPEVREYYTQVVTAILLAYNKKYGNNGLQLNYRFKAPNSIANKMQEYVDKKHSPDSELRPSQPMYDGFAMKLITSEVPSLLYSRDEKKFFDTDKTLAALVEERKANYKFLEKMQEFKSKLVEDEFEVPPKYNLKISEEEYLSNCISVLKRTRSLIDPEEVDLLKAYDIRISTMEDKLNISRDDGSPTTLISSRDLENPSNNFLLLLNDFESRMHNEIAMAVLTRKFTSLFKENSELFDLLGIKLSKDKDTKRKRTKNGYESNFLYIDTLFGTIECQLQTYQQYEQGKTGTAAHMLYKSSDSSKDSPKALPRLVPIPNRKEMRIPDVARRFLKSVLEVSPHMYSVTLGRERTKDIEFGAFRNYYSIFSEIPPTHDLAPQFQQYFSNLRDRSDSPLNNYPDKLRQYNSQDLEDYVSGKGFRDVQDVAKLWISHSYDFADTYSAINQKRKSRSGHNSVSDNQMKIEFSDFDDGER